MCAGAKMRACQERRERRASGPGTAEMFRWRQGREPRLSTQTSSNLNGRYPLHLVRGPFSSSCFLSRAFLVILLVYFLPGPLLLPLFHSFPTSPSQRKSTTYLVKYYVHPFISQPSSRRDHFQPHHPLNAHGRHYKAPCPPT